MQNPGIIFLQIRPPQFPDRCGLLESHRNYALQPKLLQLLLQRLSDEHSKRNRALTPTEHETWNNDCRTEVFSKHSRRNIQSTCPYQCTSHNRCTSRLFKPYRRECRTISISKNTDYPSARCPARIHQSLHSPGWLGPGNV